MIDCSFSLLNYFSHQEVAPAGAVLFCRRDPIISSIDIKMDSETSEFRSWPFDFSSSFAKTDFIFPASIF